MSFDAIRWALAQEVTKSPAKFLLVAMANCVNESEPSFICWPSVAHLSKATAQDRKTVLAGMKYLQQQGFIVDTGNKAGQTKQIAIYLLRTPEPHGVVGVEQSQISLETVPKTEAFAGTNNGISACSNTIQNSTESDTVEQTQNRNSSENGTVPNFPGNSTVFPVEQSQISLETVPKTGHGTSKEPVKEPVKEDKKRAKPAFDASLVELPEWLPAETWSMWVKYRAQAKKPITEDAARLQLRKLEKIRAEGHSPVLVIEAAIENGWQGLFTAKDGSTLATKCPASSIGAASGAYWVAAGFPNVWEAENERCYAHNAHLFRDGRRMEVPA